MVVVSAVEAVTLWMSWLVVFFLVYVLVAHKLGFGARGVMAGMFYFILFPLLDKTNAL